MAGFERIYLDHNASAPLRPSVVDAMTRAFATLPGNASSVHAEGRRAREAIETARDAVAALVGVPAAQVVFTSGGTEACNTALSPALRRRGPPRSSAPPRLLIGATEHPACLAGHRFAPADVEVLPVARDGVVDLAALDDRVAASADRPLVVAVQGANGETGVLQSLDRIAARLARHPDAVLFSDMVQVAGRLPIDLPGSGADAVALSAHKLGGPAGIGALVLSDAVEIGAPWSRGGGQEGGRRAGTENVAGIVGFGVAAAEAAQALEGERSRLRVLRDRLEAGLRAAAPGIVVFGAGTARLPNTVAFAVPGVSAQTALMVLDLAGVAASSGSACSSGSVRPSHVLAAMGVAADLAGGAIRLSLGWNSTACDVDAALRAFERLVSSPYPRQAAA